MMSRAIGYTKMAALDVAGLMARSRKRQLLGFRLMSIGGDIERGGRHMDTKAITRPAQNVSRIGRVAEKAFKKSLVDRGAAEMMQEA